MTTRVLSAMAGAPLLGLYDSALGVEEKGASRARIVGSGTPRPRSVNALGEARSDAELLELMHLDPLRGAPLLYDRFYRDVNRLVWRLLGADPEHDDLVQLVFMKIFQGSGRVRDAAKLAAWVRSVTINVTHDELRRRQVRRLILRDAPTTEVHPSLVHDIEMRDLLLRARRVMDGLPAKERIVFLLHVLEGQPLAEISELCGHSLATSKRRLARATRRFNLLVGKDPELKKLLSDDDGDPERDATGAGS